MTAHIERKSYLWVVRMTAVILASIIGGCAIHPLPENVIPYDTYAIVYKIRCEGRDALDSITIRKLQASNVPSALRLADMIAKRQVRSVNIINDPHLIAMIDRDTREILKLYATTAVTFDFSFTMKEDNNQSLSAVLTAPITGGSVSLGPTAGLDLTRQNKRQFRITNTFYQLHDLDVDACERVATHAGNLIYPIAGKIGLEEVFETFVDIDLLPGANATPEKRLYSDRLNFQTVASADGSPTVNLTPVGKSLQFKSATGFFSVMRDDTHQVTISLAKGKLLAGAELEKARKDARGRPLAVVAAEASAAQQSRALADLRRTEAVFQNLRDAGLINPPPR